MVIKNIKPNKKWNAYKTAVKKVVILASRGENLYIALLINCPKWLIYMLKNAYTKDVEKNVILDLKERHLYIAQYINWQKWLI